MSGGFERSLSKKNITACLLMTYKDMQDSKICPCL